MATDGVIAEDGQAEKPYIFTSTVTYATPEHADMVRNTLAVDPELRPKLVSRELSTDGCELKASIRATDLRTLRGAVGPFCDLLKLATRVLDEFG